MGQQHLMKRVLVVGGSQDLVGAVYLAGISALRSGAGSVVVAAPEKVCWAINALSPDLITIKLPGRYLGVSHRRTIIRQLKTADILFIGNGATVRPGSAKLMRTLMRWPGQKVVDADALKALTANGVANAILTPNEGEWNILQKNNSVKKLLSHNNVIMRKGAHAILMSRGKIIHMRQANRGLLRAGTGDVLAGLCAGFLADGLSLFHAAKSAAEMSARIADVLTKRKGGYYFLASDIADELKRVSHTKAIRTLCDIPSFSAFFLVAYAMSGIKPGQRSSSICGRMV